VILPPIFLAQLELQVYTDRPSPEHFTMIKLNSLCFSLEYDLNYTTIERKKMENAGSCCTNLVLITAASNRLKEFFSPSFIAEMLN
jgi:hypothetical protein